VADYLACRDSDIIEELIANLRDALGKRDGFTLQPQEIVNAITAALNKEYSLVRGMAQKSSKGRASAPSSSSTTGRAASSSSASGAERQSPKPPREPVIEMLGCPYRSFKCEVGPIMRDHMDTCTRPEASKPMEEGNSGDERMRNMEVDDQEEDPSDEVMRDSPGMASHKFPLDSMEGPEDAPPAGEAEEASDIEAPPPDATDLPPPHDMESSLPMAEAAISGTNVSESDNEQKSGPAPMSSETNAGVTAGGNLHDNDGGTVPADIETENPHAEEANRDAAPAAAASNATGAGAAAASCAASAGGDGGGGDDDEGGDDDDDEEIEDEEDPESDADSDPWPDWELTPEELALNNRLNRVIEGLQEKVGRVANDPLKTDLSAADERVKTSLVTALEEVLQREIFTRSAQRRACEERLEGAFMMIMSHIESKQMKTPRLPKTNEADQTRPLTTMQMAAQRLNREFHWAYLRADPFGESGTRYHHSAEEATKLGYTPSDSRLLILDKTEDRKFIDCKEEVLELILPLLKKAHSEERFHTCNGNQIETARAQTTISKLYLLMFVESADMAISRMMEDAQWPRPWAPPDPMDMGAAAIGLCDAAFERYLDTRRVLQRKDIWAAERMAVIITESHFGSESLPRSSARRERRRAPTCICTSRLTLSSSLPWKNMRENTFSSTTMCRTSHLPSRRLITDG
jgi:hypothetical protein